MPQVLGEATKPVGGLTAKVAVTFLAALIVIEQMPMPEHAPLHPVKVEPAFGVAVRVTMVLCAKEEEQFVVQVIPVGTEVTVPEPAPLMVTPRAYTLRANVAETVQLLMIAPVV